MASDLGDLIIITRQLNDVAQKLTELLNKRLDEVKG